MKHFLSHRFDERDGRLSCNGHQVTITRKAADLLHCLIDHAGTVVPHASILASVWPDAHVHSDNIKVLVRELRRALGDDPRAPRYIRSEPGRGYAFVAPLCGVLALGDPSRASGVPVHVNRHRELSALTSALAGAMRGECRVVLLEGERGMGKTALVEAFLQYVAALPSVRAGYGQSLPHAGEAEPYFAVFDALSHLARQAPAAIEPMLARHAPLWMASLLPWLADGRAVASSSGAAEPLRMMRELSAALEAFAADATTVIVLDDLQWGDLETVDLLCGLARRRAPLRTLIVATCSPFPSTASAVALHTLAVDLSPAGRCTRLALHPFDADDVRACLIARFGSGPIVALAHTLYRLSGGNPMSLASVLDAVVEEEIVSEGAEGWQVREPVFLDRELRSEAILDAIFWRFTQLSTDDRELLESAAAVGTVFSLDDVATAAGRQAVRGVESALDVLCARKFIKRLAGHAGSTRPLYAFFHPVHANLLATRAPILGQLSAAKRLADDAERSVQDRCG
jgi:DNA-binding winged helix-turn-helix (wHTH) protein